MKNQNNRQQAHENETIWSILIIGIVCIIFFLIGVFASGYWLVGKFSKPAATGGAKHPDSLNYIYNHSQITKTTLK